MPGLCFPPTGAGDQEGGGAGALGDGEAWPPSPPPTKHLCAPGLGLVLRLGYTSFVSKIRAGLEPELAILQVN